MASGTVHTMNPMLMAGGAGSDSEPSSDDEEHSKGVQRASAALVRNRSESQDGAFTSSLASRSANSTAAMAAAIFQRHDTNGDCELDADELAAALRSMGAAADQQAVRTILAGSDAISLQEFVAWHSRQQSTGGMDAAVKRLGRKVERGLQTLQTAVLGPQDTATRPVPPESLFVLDTRSNEATRQDVKVAQRIYDRFGSEFTHLEDHIRHMEQSNHWTDVWQRVAEQSFDEEACAKELGWSMELVAVARETTIKTTGQTGYGTALCRVFLRVVAPSISGRYPGSKLTAEHVRSKAQKFALSRRNELEDLLSEDHVPVEAAVGAVKEAMEQELSFRRKKIEALQRRLEVVPRDMPAGVLVSGLRGAAASCNGLYVVSGLRHFFGRSIWAQRGGSNVLFYDVSSESPHVSSGMSEGVWVLGPTLSSGRCTAWLSDPGGQAYSPPLTSTAADSDSEWMVYDTLKAKWVPAPGTHCPQFAIEMDADSETMQQYLQAAVKDQETVLRHAQARLTAHGFDETLRATLGVRAGPNGTISRGDYSAWRTDFYSEELRRMQTTLAKQIVNSFPTDFSNDAGDNRAKVIKVIKDFTHSAEASLQERKHAKLRFLSQIGRPTVARAFFAWKLVARRKISSSELQTGTMFAEPQLPWNIRHPRSDFTSCWEAVQALLLVYIAFVVPWRISFGVLADEWSFLWFFEIAIDLYFTADILLNMHTAYYDASGDLQGLRSVGNAVGKPDYKVLYLNYARGWMIIDVASVLPVNAIARLFAQGQVNPDTSSKLQLVKGLRLLRLTKLLRLARGLRIFAKYEETLGPTLKAVILIGTVMLLFHLLNCIWYNIGTVYWAAGNEESSLEGRRSGWVDHKFGLSDALCGCHNASAIYYDSVERMCVDTSDKVTGLMDVCPDTKNAAPTLTGYYLQSLMTALHNPGLDRSYTNTLPELLMSAGITGIMGFIWGAVAGAWGTIFSANQMASQKFRLKLAEIKEFCRVKGLDYGVTVPKNPLVHC